MIELLTALVVIMFIWIGLRKRKKVKNVKQISGLELKEFLKDTSQNRVFLDVRSVEEYRNGRIKGFINMPLHLLPIKISEIPKDKEIVLICASGARSMQAAMFLHNNGFEHVVNVRGGVMAI